MAEDSKVRAVCFRLRFRRPFSLLRGQVTPGGLFQGGDEFRGPQRPPGVGALTDGSDLLLLCFGELLSPCGHTPSLLPQVHFESKIGCRGAAVGRRAGPRPFPRMADQPSARGIQFRIAQRRSQMRRIKRTRIVPALPDVTARSALRYVVRNISRHHASQTSHGRQNSRKRPVCPRFSPKRPVCPRFSRNQLFLRD
jgi:hypothetical protein